MIKVIDLSNLRKIKNAIFWSEEINQLYHPTGKFEQDSFDIVYSHGNINKLKFTPILLKEWFWLVKKEGYLIIDYSPNKFSDFQKLEENMWWLWKNKYEIPYHGSISKKEIRSQSKDTLIQYLNKLDTKNEFLASKLTKEISDSTQLLRFVCKKTATTKIPDDDINKWTIGIITNGKRLDWLEQIISSIHQQKIPQYEIIVCGTYTDRKEPNFRYINFNKRNDKGWITKKKNLIVKNATYENICVIHDRIKLNKDWFKGMKKWGNCFEILGCRQLYNGERILDWITIHMIYYNIKDKLFGFDSHIDYRDWYPSIRYFGPLNIFKKNLVIKNNLWWNETLYIKQHELKEGEEIDFSRGFPRNGFIQRFNPYASVTTLAHKYPNPTFIKYDPYSFEPKIVFTNMNAYLKFTTYLFLRLLRLLHFNLILKNFFYIRYLAYALIMRLSPGKYIHYREWKSTVREGQSIFKS